MRGMFQDPIIFLRFPKFNSNFRLVGTFAATNTQKYRHVKYTCLILAHLYPLALKIAVKFLQIEINSHHTLKHPKKLRRRTMVDHLLFITCFRGGLGLFYGSSLAEKARAAWVLSASAGGTGTFSAPAATRSMSANAHKALPFLLRNGEKIKSTKLHRK